jgi:lactate dehydrogenase-like 2-hydroxyacid dehydrogenase
MKPRLVVTRRLPEAVAARVAAEFDALCADAMEPQAALAAAIEHQASALLVSGRLRLDAAMIAALPASVRIVANCAAGIDNIDIAAARARGLIVTNTPDAVSDCTADFAFMLMLNACRRGAEYSQIMQAGWRRRFGMDEMLGVRVSGKRLGILGMGRIGQAVARRARGFGMRVLYHNRTPLAPELAQGAEYFATLEAMLPQCDILSLHAPGGEGTRGIISAGALAMLPRGAVLVNTARGELVDEAALIEALGAGQLFAAGLDVFAREPDYDLRLRDLPNVSLTPHMGSATQETRTAMAMRALDNITAVCAGRPPLDPVC